MRPSRANCLSKTGTVVSADAADAPVEDDQELIEVQIAAAGPVPAVADLTAWAAAVLESVPARGRGPAPAGPGELCIRLVEAAESALLNAQYRHRDGPTNVLSFPAGVAVPGGRFWGDVVICVPRVHEEAAAQGKAAADHFAHLVVHGVLHLLGYDHESAAEADALESLERGVLDRFGIADPYGEE